MKEKKQIEKKTLILIISIVLLSLIAVTGLTIAFMLNYNGYSPAKPTVLDDGENIYISMKANDNYDGYRFSFYSSDGEIIIDSKQNIISTDKIIEAGGVLGKTYKVKSCYLSEKSGNNSEYSNEIVWTCEKYLDKVVLSYDEQNKVLRWNEIEHAEAYHVFYNGLDDEYIQTNDNFFDLSDIAGGEKSFSVIAVTSEDGYKTNSQASKINFRHVHFIENFSSINFDASAKIVTAVAENYYENIIIYLDLKGYFVNTSMFEVENSEGGYTYKIDISSIYNDEKRIGILPDDIDEYNINDGEVKYFTIDETV